MFFHCFLKSGWISIENTLGHILKCGKLDGGIVGVVFGLYFCVDSKVRFYFALNAYDFCKRGAN